MATIFRPPVIRRKQNPVFRRSKDFAPPNLLLTTLRSQDDFFGSNGQPPQYDLSGRTYDSRRLRSQQPIPNLLLTTLAGQDASVNVTGLEASIDFGSQSVTGEANTSVTGIEVSTSVGSVAVQTEDNFAVLLVGQLLKRRNVRRYPPPLEDTGLNLILSTLYSVDTSVNTTGLEATGSTGSVSVTADANTSVTGLEAESAIKGVSVQIDDYFAIFRISPSSLKRHVNKRNSLDYGGLALYYLDASVSVTGLEATTSIGNESTTGDANTSVTGLEATSAIGDESVQTEDIYTLLLNQLLPKARLPKRKASQDYQNILLSLLYLDASVSVTGLEATTSIGNESTTGDANTSVTGLEATSAIGDESVQTEDIYALLLNQSLSKTVVHRRKSNQDNQNILLSLLGTADANVSVTGLEAVGSVGDESVMADVYVNRIPTLPKKKVVRKRTPAEIPNVLLNLFYTLDDSVNVTGLEATGQVGEVSVQTDEFLLLYNARALNKRVVVRRRLIQELPNLVLTSLFDPNVSVNVTGLSATGSVGSVQVDTGNVVTALYPTGVPGPYRVFSDSALSVDVSVTGLSATGSVGNETVTAEDLFPLLGSRVLDSRLIRKHKRTQESTNLLSTLYSISVSVNVTGILATGSVGDESVQTEDTYYLLLSQSLSRAKKPRRKANQDYQNILLSLLYLDASVSVTGLEATTSIGNESTTGDANTSVTGLEATSAIGEESVQTEDSLLLLSSRLLDIRRKLRRRPRTDQYYNLPIFYTTGVSVNVSGLSGATSLGNESTTGDANTSVTGLVGTSGIGSVVADLQQNVNVTGLSATGVVGNETASGSANVSVTGLQCAINTGTAQVITAELNTSLILNCHWREYEFTVYGRVFSFYAPWREVSFTPIWPQVYVTIRY